MPETLSELAAILNAPSRYRSCRERRAEARERARLARCEVAFRAAHPELYDAAGNYDPFRAFD